MELSVPKSMIYKTLIWDGRVSLSVLDTTALVRETMLRHHTSLVATAALGRTMTATAYLCSWLKDAASQISVTIAGNGPGGKIRVAGDGDLHIRGFVEHPETELEPRSDGKLNVGGFTGSGGYLTVVRDDGEALPFIGTSALVSGEIAEDFSAYFLTSEQRPTAIALGVRIGSEGVIAAGGLFLQPLPGYGEEVLSRIESEIGKFSDISRLISEKGAEGILAMFAPLGEVSVRGIDFRCRCSRERTAGVVRSLGKSEAEAILKEQGKISVYCHDCNTTYSFDEEDVAALFAEEDHEGR